jgi:beta-lactamase class A
LRADEVFPTASLIKVPIALGLLQRVQSGELDWKAPVPYDPKYGRGGDDLVAKLTPGAKVEPNKLLFLMESLSDNTASVWCEDLAGGGATINAWMEAHGYRVTRVNSRVAGRESDYKQYGWGQTTPREMAEMLVAIRERRAVSPAADEHLDRMLGRAYWDGEALSSVPSDVHVISKQGAVNASRSEVLLVSAPHGSYVLCVITKNQVDQSWDDSNAGFRLLRAASAIVWQHMEPERPYAAALAGPRWP